MTVLRSMASAVVAALALACGGTTTDPLLDGGSEGQAQDGQPQDVAPDTNGPWPCGSSTCGSGDLCIHPCCGGAAPMCIPFEDGGTCPAGYTPSTQCYGLGTGTSGCMPPPCTPPPPYCAPASSGQFCSPYNQSQPRDCYETCA